MTRPMGESEQAFRPDPLSELPVPPHDVHGDFSYEAGWNDHLHAIRAGHRIVPDAEAAESYYWENRSQRAEADADRLAEALIRAREAAGWSTQAEVLTAHAWAVAMREPAGDRETP